MKISFSITLLILIFNNCLSQTENQIRCTLKSQNLDWVELLNEQKDINKKVRLVRNKIISDSIECTNSMNKPLRFKVLPNISISESLKFAYENTDFHCDILFILSVKKKYAMPLNAFDSGELDLIQTTDIDSITTLTKYELTHIYGSQYCGIVFLHSSNRKLKRKVKNVLQHRL